MSPLTAKRGQITNVRLTVVCDKPTFGSGLQHDRGFACVIDIDRRRVLFNTGRDGAKLLANLEALGESPGDIEAVIISCMHINHVGGLLEFLECNPEATVYVPNSVSADLADAILSLTGKPAVRVTAPSEIRPNLFSLGALVGFFEEQILAILTAKGVVLVTGCARPGIRAIWNETRRLFPYEPIYLALGGFHLARRNETEIAQTVTDFVKLEIQKVAPCHCSGQDARELFKKTFGRNYLDVGAGRVVEIEAQTLSNVRPVINYTGLRRSNSIAKYSDS